MDSFLILAADPTAWVALAALIVMEVVLGIDNLGDSNGPSPTRTGQLR
jgi:predicted tellurium resistance membrane protein TerC